MTHDPREALEPCPFCGTELDIDRNISDTGVYWVMCHQCSAEGPPVNPKAEAIKAWNTRALTASPGEQEPVAWRYELAGCRVWENCKPVGWSDWEWRISETKPNAGEAMRNVTPLYLSPPPAAGWGITDDMVEDACKAYADATGYYVQFHRGLSSESSDKMRKGMRAALEALRREAPSPEGVAPTHIDSGGRAIIEGGDVVIRFPLDAMQIAIDGAWSLKVFDTRYKITNIDEFSKEFVYALNREDEQGTTNINRLADKAFIDCIESGAFGIEEHEQQEI